MHLGLDIAKRTFDAALLGAAPKPKHRTFDNTPSGHQELQRWLAKQGAAAAHACMEATGPYGEALALFLHAQGYRVSIVNPAALAAYAQSRLARAKTDKVDAHLIATYCAKEEPPAWTPPAPEFRELQALVRRLEALESMRQMERNRLAAGAPVASVRASLEEHLAYLDRAITETRQAISRHLDDHPNLQQQRDLLLSIPGIGATTAAWLLAELGDAQQFASARQVAAFAGVTPRIHRSGASVHKRESFCKTGSPRLRCALYFPAIVALRFNPLLHALGARLTERGKPKMVIIGAAMRKLLHLAFGVLKSGQAFDPGYAEV